MGLKFWLIRSIKVFSAIAALLFVVELLKQHPVLESILFALAWSFVATGIFIGSRLYQSRKGVECALCDDMPKVDSKDN